MLLSSNRGSRVRGHGQDRWRRHIRGLGTMGTMGTISTQVGQSLVYGSNPVSNLRRPISTIPINRWPVNPQPPIRIGPAYPIYPISYLPPWANPSPQPMPIVNPAWDYANGPTGPSGSTGPTGSLSVAQALLQSNPSLLTPAQWQQLQQAGLVAGTVPYSSAGQVPGSSSAIDPATGQTYASELAAAQAGALAAPATGTDIGSVLSTTYAGLPLYLWLIIGGGGFFLLSKRGR